MGWVGQTKADILRGGWVGSDMGCRSKVPPVQRNRTLVDFTGRAPAAAPAGGCDRACIVLYVLMMSKHAQCTCKHACL